MCGIAGFVCREGKADAGRLEGMLSVLRHRGPEALSGFIQGRAALGNARLKIVDLPGGVQPAVGANGQVAVVFNGEIYNYLEQRERLAGRGHRFATHSEVETLLHLYLDEGPGFVTRLNGQFAIAVWDARDESLHLYRDRMGIRPLFWHLGRAGVVFGSEIKALFRHGGLPPALNRRAIVQSFRFWTQVGETTAFEGVRQLPPAHRLTVREGQARLSRYWRWPFPGEQEPLLLRSDAEYFEAFEEELSRSVARRRMADVPVGSYLSGGIDSSVLALLLARLMGGESLRTYSITFADPEYDESGAQARVVGHLGVANTVVPIASADIGAAFPQVVWQAEAPLFRTAPTPLFHLSRRVHQDGIKVVMTGEGADEILLGYDLFREVAIRRFWARSPGSDWRGSLFGKLYAYLPQYRDPRYRAMMLDFYRPHLNDTGDPHYAMAVRWANGIALETFFSPELKAFAAVHDPVRDLDVFLPQGYDRVDDIDRAQWIECHTLLANYLLSSQGDRMSLAHGVEGRYPFLDHEFVAFAARLPRRLKLRGLSDKFILRRAFAGKLPEEVWNRPKVAYQAPDVKGFFVDGKAPEYVEELMRPERIREVGLFDDSRVALLRDKAASFRLRRVGTRDNMAFVLVLSTMLLDEIFVRGRGDYASDVEAAPTFGLVHAG